MECKEERKRAEKLPVQCINRNIVECKVGIILTNNPSIIVLIEILWNVKDFPIINTGVAIVVLIETLWNVGSVNYSV